ALVPDPVRDFAVNLGRDFAADFDRELVADLCRDLGSRGRAASRRSRIGCARRNRNSRDDGGGGLRRSRPRTPPAPPQAAWAPSTWVAAPVILAHNKRATRRLVRHALLQATTRRGHGSPAARNCEIRCSQATAPWASACALSSRPWALTCARGGSATGS